AAGTGRLRHGIAGTGRRRNCPRIRPDEYENVRRTRARGIPHRLFGADGSAHAPTGLPESDPRFRRPPPRRTNRRANGISVGAIRGRPAEDGLSAPRPVARAPHPVPPEGAGPAAGWLQTARVDPTIARAYN